MYSSRLSSLGVVCLGWTAHLQSFYHSDSERCTRQNSPGNLYARCFLSAFLFEKNHFFFFFCKTDNPLRTCRVSPVVVRRYCPEDAVDRHPSTKTRVRCLNRHRRHHRRARHGVYGREYAYTKGSDPVVTNRIHQFRGNV